ncbi:hypothetical protein [Saccharicrinis aurantiacus]|uniref:hypothetical protein n=1 Tax=Saccharicrinis aurantiacus TaxID=1849719 RepID=UPI0011151F0E|nr:hypothetical protein [Saccharicrinis aurantiacus]
MSKFIDKYITSQKFFLLMSIGLPGLSKLILAILIKHTQGLISLGEYANDMNIALIFSAVTGVGFSALIMNRAPLLSEETKKKELLARILILSILVSIISIPILILLSYYNLITNWEYVLLFILGYSLYQIYRRYLLAFKKYKKVVLYETISIFSLIILFMFFSTVNSLYIHSLSLITLYGTLNLLSSRISTISLFVKREIISGLGFGFSNISSTFLSLISIPLALQLLGPLYAGLLGIINPIIQFIILIPRSLSTYYLPDIVKFRNDIKQLIIYKKFSNTNLLFLITSTILIGLIWTLYNLVFPNSELILANSSIVLVLITLNVFSSQISLPGFTFLSAWDKSGLSFLINLISLLYFVCFLPLILKFSNEFNSFIAIYVLLITGNALRYYYIKHKVYSNIIRINVQHGNSI